MTLLTALLLVLFCSPLARAQAAPEGEILVTIDTPFLDPAKATPADYEKALAFAMEGVRLARGKMSVDEEKQFQAQWEPYRDNLAPGTVSTLNEINSLVGEFLRQRAVILDGQSRYEALKKEADGAKGTLAKAASEKAAAALRDVEARQAGLQQITQLVVVMGEPPAPATKAKPTPKPTPPPAEKPPVKRIEFPPPVPAAVPPYLDAAKLTPAQFAGAVSFAMESMRLIYGELTPAEEKKFQDKWNPLFEHCTPEVIDYFNALNPLLGQFLGIRAALSETAAGFDSAQLEAAAAVDLGDADAMRAALDEANLWRLQMESLQAAMNAVVKAIADLGDPPDFEASGRRRRQQHDKIRADAAAPCRFQLSWREPPAGWREEAYSQSSYQYLDIRGDEDRHIVLGGKQSPMLRFVASESPNVGMGMSASVKFSLAHEPYPEAREVEFALLHSDEELWQIGDDKRTYRLLDYKNGMGSVFMAPPRMGSAPAEKDFTVTRDFCMGYPALRTEVVHERELDPAKGENLYEYSRDVTIWYAVDFGLAEQECWLVVSVQMMFCDRPLDVWNDTYPPEWVKRDALLERVRAMTATNWKALFEMWLSEQDLLLGNMELEHCLQEPASEAARYSAPEPPGPTPEELAACGRPQLLNGSWTLFADAGHRNGETLQGMDAYAWVQGSGGQGMCWLKVQTSHAWTPPPESILLDEPFSLTVEAPEITCFTSSACAGYGDGARISNKDLPPGKEDDVLLSAYTDFQLYFETVDHVAASTNLPGRGGDRPRATTAQVVVTAAREGPDSRRTLQIPIVYGLSGSATRGLNEKSAAFFYLWQWAPSRQGRSAGAAGGGMADVISALDAALAASEAEGRRRQIEFYENEIKYRTEQLENLRRLQAAGDPSSFAEFERQIMWAEDWIQRARDAITTLQTGQFTRTRTRADEFNLSVMAAQSRKLADEWHTKMRVAQRGNRLIDMAPAGERDQLRRFLNGQLTPETIANADLARFRRIIGAVGNRVIGSLEQQSASAELEAIDAAERLERAENVKTVCDTEVMILSMGGGPLGVVNNIYMGTTGFIEGGPLEGIKRLAASYNTATGMASTAMDSYTKGVVDAYEQYARDPSRGPVDESSAGLTSMAWGLGKDAAMALASHYVIKPILGPLLAQPPSAQKKTLAELAAEMRYYKARAEGMDTVDLFRTRLAEVQAASRAGAPTAEIDRLQADVEAVYRLVKTNYHAKMYVNQLGRQGNMELLRRYNAYDHFAMQQVQTRVRERMRADGLPDLEYRLYSNSDSCGRAGIDVDLGVVEPPRFIQQGSTQVPNPAHQAWLRNLTRPGPDGRPRRITTEELRQIGQHNLAEAFHEVMGYDPRRSAGREAFVNFTTSNHPEAYRDLAWLGRRGMRTADIDHIDPAWAQQAASVTGFKVHDLPRHHPQFDYYSTLQEQSRGLVKDFDTKLTPLIQRNARNPQAAQHMRELRDVMNRFAQGEIGPVEADRRIKELTGGRGICEVAAQYKFMLEGLTR